ncbi:MAG: hypothetical protein LUC90_07820 [Lachnospiraceae bacterium]|nr:hypothetical protein [Lachnospiraceae bacterium]
MANAKAAIEASSGELTAQENEVYYTALSDAYAGLTARTASGQYAIDFGPAQESDEQSAQVATNILLSGYFENSPSENELMTGVELYETNEDDNGLHYGFTSEVSSTFTSNGGAYFRDFVYCAGGNSYTFKADLPAGTYAVYVYTGCKDAANTTQFYFGDGEAVLAYDGSESSTLSEVVEGKTVYTQTSSSGGQYSEPGCIYLVTISENSSALSYVNGVSMGTLSITFFDNTSTDEVTARLCGLCICPLSDTELANLGVEPEPEEEPVDYGDTYADYADVQVVGSYDFGTRNGSPSGWISTDTTAYSESLGYGYLTTSTIDTSKGSSIAQSDPATDIEAACSDFAYASDELSFAVDVPAGTYKVEVYAGNGTSNSAYNENKIYVNSDYLGKVSTSTAVSDILMTGYVTLAEDGQIVITASNVDCRAFLNAVVITEIALESEASTTAVDQVLAEEAELTDEEAAEAEGETVETEDSEAADEAEASEENAADAAGESSAEEANADENPSQEDDTPEETGSDEAVTADEE